MYIRTCTYTCIYKLHCTCMYMILHTYLSVPGPQWKWRLLVPQPVQREELHTYTYMYMYMHMHVMCIQLKMYHTFLASNVLCLHTCTYIVYMHLYTFLCHWGPSADVHVHVCNFQTIEVHVHKRIKCVMCTYMYIIIHAYVRTYCLCTCTCVCTRHLSF